MAASPRPAPAGLFARVAGGLRYAMTGTPPAWFGPSAPLTPEAPPQTAGRQFDYPVSFNLRLQPRQDEGTSFADLRGLADAYDLVRLVIETRKDQIEAMDWQVRSRRDGTGDDPRIAAIEDLLRSPDREHPWSAWIRMLLEDLFVLDAPALYVRRTATGALWGLEVIDGATIKRLLGPDGRTPRAPDPAYQQVLKGVPAVDYTTDELIYAPRNPRPHKVYGYSPVEQILMTVNIGLRRQVSQLNYFTEGNTPEALIGVPEEWTPDQIRQFQEYWDALLEGNLAARRHTRFVPGGLKYQPIRDVPLKDEFDEWLARVVCFAFSIPPTAFARETNRATAETALGTAIAEGLQPLLVWLKGLIDRVITQVLGCDDLEFAWADRSVPDPQVQASIAAAYVGAGIKTRNEVRAELGLDPVAGGDALTTAGPATPLPGGLAKVNANWPQEPRGAHQRWIRGGGLEDQAHLILAQTAPIEESAEPPQGNKGEAELSGEERIENFDAMPPYVQASILSVRDPVARGRLMDNQDLAETYYRYTQAVTALQRADPNNPLLSNIRSDSWLPTNEDVDRLQTAVTTATRRPSWRQSEADVGLELGPTARPQVSYKDGLGVPSSTPGSVRPDFSIDDVAAIEVKNYDIANNTSALIARITDQAIERASHLPAGMKQEITIDIRGQTVTQSQREDIIARIVEKAAGSLDPTFIRFKEDN
jgi:HK97 family phage portal protein